MPVVTFEPSRKAVTGPAGTSLLVSARQAGGAVGRIGHDGVSEVQGGGHPTIVVGNHGENGLAEVLFDVLGSDPLMLRTAAVEHDFDVLFLRIHLQQQIVDAGGITNAGDAELGNDHDEIRPLQRHRTQETERTRQIDYYVRVHGPKNPKGLLYTFGRHQAGVSHLARPTEQRHAAGKLMDG